MQNRYFRSVNNFTWNQIFYLNLEEEVHPFNEPERFRSLNRAYDGNNTFWSTPSPEPDLSDSFWQDVQLSFTKDSDIHGAAQKLAASILQWQPDPEKIIFVSILRAGVPITEWLCKMLPGSVGAALSLFVGIGIDKVALSVLQKDFPDRSLVFVDGWTGRGGVSREIAKLEQGPLAVLIDPWGWADFAGVRDDIFCPSACFTGLATLGFSRTFVADSNNFFSAYRFSDRFAKTDLIRAWQSSTPLFPASDFCCISETAPSESESKKFHAKTDLRIHSNEVCRALINADPKTLLFADDPGFAMQHFPLLLKLAKQRGVESKFNVKSLKELKTKVACSL